MVVGRKSVYAVLCCAVHFATDVLCCALGNRKPNCATGHGGGVEQRAHLSVPSMQLCLVPPLQV